MPITINAVYEGGVLRPVQPLPLEEGETVQVTVARMKSAEPTLLRRPTPEEEDHLRRLKAARSLEEMLAVMATAPPSPLPEGYDLCRALNANRKATGERLLFSELEDEGNP